MLITKILTLFKIFWNFIYSVLLISPIAFFANGFAGIICLVSKWFDESLDIWDNIYHDKLLSLIANRKNEQVDGFFQFEHDYCVRYNDYPKYIQVYAHSHEIIMERKQKSLVDDDFTIYPDYEVYNLDSPFVGMLVSYDELVRLHANVRIVNM